VATAIREVATAADAIGDGPWVVKAQIHAGARGKAGGVVVCPDRLTLDRESARLIGSRMRTPQSGGVALPVGSVLIEETLPIERELYLGMLVDRVARRVLIMASAAGGMGIEELAATQPDALLFTHINPATGLQPWQVRRVGFFLGLDGPLLKQLDGLMNGLYRLFVDSDASLIEMNPLIVGADGRLVALDGKINLDDNGVDRHPDLVAMRDVSQEDELEAEAKAHDLNYIALDGDIGCMVNGAGLAMATMDLIKIHGGHPANFLDVGGGATAERVAVAFKLILSDCNVKAVLVNIFGGIVRCDLIAEGIITAVQEVGVEVPVVVRLEGTNAARGLELLSSAGVAIETAAGLAEAADKVVAAAAAQDPDETDAGVTP
jgi:succinyl-CoA synthetase beta subunit